MWVRRLYSLLDVIRQVIEEIQSSELLQLTNRERQPVDVLTLAVVSVFGEEGNAFVRLALLHQKRHPVVAGDDHLTLDALGLDLIIADRPTLGDVEPIAEGAVACPFLDAILQAVPDAGIMSLELRTHIRVVEGLFVGGLREGAVFRGYQMSAAVATSAEEVGCIIRRGDLRIPAPRVTAAHVVFCRRSVERECNPARMELRDVVLERVVYLPRSSVCDEVVIVAPSQSW